MLRIIIVDDESIVRVALRSMTNWEEHDIDIVGTAGDGEEAYNLVLQNQPDIVVTDLKMPKMDGLQLIKKLKETGYSGKILVLSNYGDFELVKQAMMLGAVDYILKVTMITDNFVARLKSIGEDLAFEREQKDRMLKEKILVRQSMSIVKSNFFKRLLMDEDKPDYQSISREAENAGLYPVLQRSFMLFIYIDENEKNDSAKINDKKQLLYAVQNITCEYLSKVQNIHIVEIDAQTLVILIPNKEFQIIESTPEKAAEKLVSLFKLYLNIDVTILISVEFEGFYGARSTYSACAKVLTYRFYRANRTIIFQERLKIAGMDYKINWKKEIQPVLAFINAGDAGAAFEHIKVIINDAGEADCDPNYLKKSIIKLLEGLEEVVRSSYDIQEPVLENSIEQLYLMKTEVSFEKLTFELLNKLKAIVRMDSSHSLRKEVNDAIGYIHDHISNKITISEIGRHVNLNESHLCRLFKNETGKSIISFINEARMKMAVELIQKQELSFKEIACKVGIEDQFYFNRIFKKQYGMNPTSFKKNMKQKGLK